jgi:hypothetical protein
MSQPDPIGPLETLLKRNLPVSNKSTLGFKDWHTFRVKSPNGGLAGRWCNEMIKGSWTFQPDFGNVIFYIKDDNDAMLFKLAWGGAQTG